MIHAAAGRRIPTELSRDRRFERRVRRLALVSAGVLGLVWVVEVSTVAAPPLVDSAFAAGWLLMPTTLVASLARPGLRYALVVPASTVSLGLLAVCLGWLPGDAPVAAGWVLLMAGVGLGGGLGLWLWYRLLPVPAILDDPFSTGRWALIGVHVALAVAGLGLASLALWR